MKTKSLVLSNISMSVIFSAIVVMIYAFTFSTAFAAVVPTIDTVIKNNSDATVTSAPIGTVVRANTTVSSSTGPTVLGTVDFSLYPNTTCSGVGGVQSGVLLATGVANSATTTVGASGLSYKVFYSGQEDVYASTTSPCVPLQPTSSVVTLNSTLSSTSIVKGTSVFQSSTLSGVTANATGTVAYGIYTNNSCSADRVDAGVKIVANGVVPQSNSTQFNTVGTFYLRADYSGDQFNNAVNGPCQTLSVLEGTVVVPPPSGSNSIGGNVYNDLNKNRTKDSGEAGISNVTIKLYDRSIWWNWRSRWNGTASFITTTTDANGNYSFGNLADGIYGIEEVVPSGWKQISSDFRWVFVINGKNYSNLDFANYAKVSTDGNATTTPPKKDDNHKNKGQEKKQEKMEQKEIKKAAQKEKKINKLLERINKIKNKNNDDDKDD